MVSPTNRGPVRPVGSTDAKVEEVVVKTLEETPPDATHWSTRQMAEAVGISASSVSKIWRAFGLKPHPDRRLQGVARSVVRR